MWPNLSRTHITISLDKLKLNSIETLTDILLTLEQTVFCMGFRIASVSIASMIVSSKSILRISFDKTHRRKLEEKICQYNFLVLRFILCLSIERG